ncbi:MAG TPA: hypothetical protein VHW44_07535 [Pseudonocardiaceae bacterium]|jgi:hypothetical protein|nr:hypothetical protein [Pseudonocardiaceae bacterium]
MTEEKKNNNKTEIRPTQLIAGALAAITAAFLGSRIGVGGTIAGAGVASAVTTVGSALYQRSLERTRETLRSKVSSVRNVEARAANARTTIVRPVRRPDDQTTRMLRPVSPPTGTVSPPRDDKPWWRRWQVLAGLTAGMFLLGMAVVTGVELLHGGPISGGSAGTTVGSLFGEPTQRTQPADPTTPTTGSSTPTSTAPTSTAATPTPSSSTTVAPSTSAQPGETTNPTTTQPTGVTPTTTPPPVTVTSGQNPPGR